MRKSDKNHCLKWERKIVSDQKTYQGALGFLRGRRCVFLDLPVLHSSLFLSVGYAVHHNHPAVLWMALPLPHSGLPFHLSTLSLAVRWLLYRNEPVDCFAPREEQGMMSCYIQALVWQVDKWKAGSQMEGAQD